MVIISITFARVYLGVGDGGLSLVQDHPDLFDVDTSIPQNTHTHTNIYIEAKPCVNFRRHT